MSDEPLSRRRVLAVTASLATSVGLAGCLADWGSGDANVDDARTTGVAESKSPTTTGETLTSNPEETTHTTNTTNTTDATTAEQTTTLDRPKDVAFDAPHGATIEGTLYGQGSCGVVLVPQINLDRGSWAPQASTLADAGHLVLTIDEDPENRSASVRGAMSYLRDEHGIESLVLVGASSGGEAVVVANATAPAGSVDATITISAGGGVTHAGDLQGRTLFVVSENDDDRFVRVARELHEGAPDPTNLVTYSGSAHGQRLFSGTHGEALRSRILDVTAAACKT